MTRLIVAELEKRGIGFENLHGGIPSKKRKDLVERFTDDPQKRVFVSTDAGSTGLNLQVASIIINIDLPWNPAVLEQRVARIYRIGQQRNIQVVNLVAANTIEERMLATLNFKSSLFQGILDQGDDVIFLENSKLEKIIEDLKAVAEVEFIGQAHDTSGAQVSEDDCEQMIDETFEKEPKVNTSPNFEEEENVDPIPASITASSIHKEEENVEHTELLNQGMAFFSGLAKALASPEETEKLVNTIVKDDKETGEVSLNIPVANKEAVKNILNLFGKLLQG